MTPRWKRWSWAVHKLIYSRAATVRGIRRQITRDKTTRRAAVRYLIEAYEQAGVSLPEASDQLAA
jgi:hypothetical protein